MTATLNGRPQRKQLSDQLDRFDVLLDGLAEALPQAVADATREGSRQAVREVLTELFGSPEGLARFRQAHTGPAPAEPVPGPQAAVDKAPGVFARIRAAVKDAVGAVVARVKDAVAAIRDQVRSARDRASAAVRTVRGVVPLGRFAAVALAVGFVVACVSYVAPQGFAAAVSGIGAVVVTGVLQTYRWLRKSARSVGLLA